MCNIPPTALEMSCKTTKADNGIKKDDTTGAYDGDLLIFHLFFLNV